MKNKTTLVLLILTFSVLVSNINVLSAVEENNNQPNSLELTPHDPIEITSDSDLEVFPGTGTVEDPYIIEGYNITTTEVCGIDLASTTKHFIIRNCYIDSSYYGIVINNVADGTATVINNTCNNNENGNGISLMSSVSSTVINNKCNNNDDYGIQIASSGSSTVINNKCNNNDYGIWISSSSSCVVTYNLLQENEEHGIYIYNSDDNLIHHNTFVDNNLEGTSQAYDDGTDNLWYDTKTDEGNYWSDWSGTGSYTIEGSTSSEDLYPLDEPAEYTVATDETQLYFIFTLLILVVPLFFIRAISRKLKK